MYPNILESLPSKNVPKIVIIDIMLFGVYNYVYPID